VTPVAWGGQPVLKDMSPVSAFFKLSFKAMDAALAKAGVPADPNVQFRPFTAVELQLERVEVDAEGKEIGKPVVIPPIQPPQFDRTKDAELANFLQWVVNAQAQQQILCPPFYQTVGQGQLQMLDIDGKLAAAVGGGLMPPMDMRRPTPGMGRPDPNMRPGINALPPGVPAELQSAPGIGNNPFDAQNALAFYRSYTPEIQAAYLKALKPADAAALRAAQRDMDSRRRRPTNDAQDPRILKEMYAQAEPDWLRKERETSRQPPQMPPGRPLPDSAQPGMRDLRGRPNLNVNPVLPPIGPGMVLLPNKDGDVLIWAHDATALAGKTYKYRARLIIKNPYYVPEAKDAVGKVLDVPSDWSEWTKPVTTPDFVNIFLAGAEKEKNGAIKNAKMYVQRWQNGQFNQNDDPFLVAPGDTVGEKVGNMDFETGWAVVDVRQAEGDTRVVLVDPAGNTQVRSEKADTEKLGIVPQPMPVQPPIVEPVKPTGPDAGRPGGGRPNLGPGGGRPNTGGAGGTTGRKTDSRGRPLPD